MKAKFSKQNIIFVIVLLILIIPQTRQSLQVLLHKGVALINPVNTVAKEERVKLQNYDWKLIKEDNSLYDFNESKGKVTLINFWATWCPPCIAEMSSLQDLYEKFGNNVEFLFVTNEPVEVVKAFKEKKNYSIPVYIKRSNEPQELQTKTIPRTVIINKEGEIIIDKVGAVDWFDEKIQSQIETLLQ